MRLHSEKRFFKFIYMFFLTEVLERFGLTASEMVKLEWTGVFLSFLPNEKNYLIIQTTSSIVGMKSEDLQSQL